VKTSKRHLEVYFEDILSAAKLIGEYIADGRGAFFKNRMIQDAVLYKLAIIGEASSKLPNTLRKKHTHVPWKSIIGLRNIVIHDYTGVKIERIWDIVEQDLPLLKEAIEKILKETKSA
jgi:uncharacterized protein with HEPN domain